MRSTVQFDLVLQVPKSQETCSVSASDKERDQSQQEHRESSAN